MSALLDFMVSNRIFQSQIKSGRNSQTVHSDTVHGIVLTTGNFYKKVPAGMGHMASQSIRYRG